jgi:hypothetical protein
MDCKEVSVGAKRLFEKFDAHHISEVSVLNDSADNESWSNFSEHFYIN